MGYVIAAILVVLIVGGFVLFLVTNAAKKSNLSPDPTPLGDTTEHAEVGDDTRFRREESRPDVAPAVDSGEAEGRRSTR
jgi:hypothetical protein